MAIRYDKELNREIDRTIKNFNQKIARLERQERELLPSKVTKKQLQSYETRADLKKKLKEMQRFTKRGAEDVITTKGGARITQFELENLKQDLKVRKAKLTREINKLKTVTPTVLGKKQSKTFAEMGDQDFLNKVAMYELLDKNIMTLTKEEIQDLKRRIKKLEDVEKYKDEVFKENYLKMLTDLGYYTGYDSSKLKMIHDEIIDLKTKDFLNLFNTERTIKAILEYYPYVTGRYKGMNPEIIKDDVADLYDALYENLYEILYPYLSNKKKELLDRKNYKIRELYNEIEKLESELSKSTNTDSIHEINKRIETLKEEIKYIIENA